jgi:hypothetical protein
MINNLEDLILVLEDAKAIRDELIADPDPESNSVTEESVIEALLRDDPSGSEVFKYNKPLTRALRIILAHDIDQQR